MAKHKIAIGRVISSPTNKLVQESFASTHSAILLDENGECLGIYGISKSDVNKYDLVYGSIRIFQYEENAPSAEPIRYSAIEDLL